MRVHLEAPSARRAREFLDAVRRSRPLHRGLVSPPSTAEAVREYLGRTRGPREIGHFVLDPAGDLAGVINLNEVVLGAFRSAYLGYYAFVPFNGKGYLSQGMGLVLARAFGKYGLHRVEANIQPDNARSIRLVARLGFRLEGISLRYLKIAGRWRDHERWAITREDWVLRRKISRKDGVLRT